MNNLELLNGTQSYALIGMNNKKKTYAHKIFTLLEKKGKTVFAVNPNYTEVEGKVSYEDVSQIEEDVEMAIMVVNPKIGEHLLDGLKEKNVKTLWFQPGSHDESLLEKAENMGFEVVSDCVLQVYYQADNT